MSWTAILILAGGSYLLKAIGLVVVGPMTHRRPGVTAAGDRTIVEANPAEEILDGTSAPGAVQSKPNLAVRIGQLLPPALLAALVVSQTVVTGTSLTVDARLAGVLAGAVAVWRRAPFWLVLIVAATVTAVVRQLS